MMSFQGMKLNSHLAGYEEPALTLLLEKVYQECGYDFRQYKRGTVVRRLERRLHATGSHDYGEYMRFLEGHPEEYSQLVNDLTIRVSEFFRSKDTFQQVAGLVLPEILQEKEKLVDHRLRFWSAACACGEEPYSIAILLRESLGPLRQDFPVSLYATDISQQALSAARAGNYTVDELKTVSPEILYKYFLRSEQGYQLREEIRQMVSFSYHDLTSPAPPPFQSLDCIFCCNILIYWQRLLQERVLNMLYDSLASPGYLVLGEAETLPFSLNGKLKRLDSEAKIYQKVNGQ